MCTIDLLLIMDILKFSIRQKINKENKIKKSNKYI